MLRPASDADKAAVLVWRNHPVVRQWSLNQDVISPDEHDRYWASLATSKGRKVYIYEHDGVPSGVVTYSDIDAEARSATLGYFLDNAGLEERVQLLPAWITMHTEAVALGFEELALDVIDGEVIDNNAAVRRLNKRNGFTDVRTEERTIGGRVVTIHKIQCRRPDHG